MSFQSAFAPTEDVLLSSPSPSAIRLSEAVLPTMEISSTGNARTAIRTSSDAAIIRRLVRLLIAECEVLVGISAGQLAKTGITFHDCSSAPGRLSDR